MKAEPRTPHGSAQCCGNCKWFDVPPNQVRKDGNVKEIYRFMSYHCRVPFERPKMPASVKVDWRDDPKYRLMCARYGEDCSFHEKR